MSTSENTITAVTAPNQFIDANGRKLAYRSIGTGKPILLCTRFRGNMDDWDPAFLDTLAKNGFRVITFDYSGLGLSTGDRTYNPLEMARDANDIMEALDLKDVVIGGWSIGGLVAQVVLAMFPQRLSHAVLMATSPPGPIVKEAEQLFYETAVIPVNSFEDEIVLFFEPRSEGNRSRAGQRVTTGGRPRELRWGAERAGRSRGERLRRQPLCNRARCAFAGGVS